ncbi:MAG: tetratricopeptide repeat protein [Candidatus Obscuribacterales bacterium]|nr:tetratricopeptide repeat protein [Candidatus Obscuribacterales bacterium]
MKTNLVFALSLALSMLQISTINCPPASAYCQERYQQGVEAYQAGELDEARNHFFTFIQHNKNYYPAHYQLGNTLVKLGEYGLARRQYQLALNLNPPANIATACKQALAQLAYLPENKKISPDVQNNTVSGRPTLYEEMSRKADELDSQRRASLEMEKKRILEEADKQAKQLISQAEQKADELHKSSNTRLYAFNDKGEITGEAGVGISTRAYNSIMQPAQEEAERIKQAARERVNRLSAGPSAAAIVSGLSNQSQIKSGTRLSSDSSLNLRNYIHSSDQGKLMAGKTSQTR